MPKTTLVFLVLLALARPASGQSAADCLSASANVEAVAQTKALLASVSAAMDQQQASLEAGMRAAAARARWSEQERAAFFRALLRSKPNADFERKIGKLTQQLRGLLNASQRGDIKGPEAECGHVARLRARVGQLKSVYEQQST